MNSKIDDKKLHQLELRISSLLRVGVLISGACLLFGWIGQLRQDGELLSTFTTYHPVPLLERMQWALLMRDRSLMMAFIGLMILVCLPVLRVAMTGVLFILQKEYKLGLMAFGVLGALVVSFCLGIDL